MGAFRIKMEAEYLETIDNEHNEESFELYKSLLDAGRNYLSDQKKNNVHHLSNDQIVDILRAYSTAFTVMQISLIKNKVKRLRVADILIKGIKENLESTKTK